MKSNGKRAHKWLKAGAAVTMLAPVLAACNAGQEEADTMRTLRIGTMYGSSQDEYYFRQQFTDLFEFAHQNIEIEVVPAIDYMDQQYDENGNYVQVDPLEKLLAIMKGDNPVDVMILNDLSSLGALVNENLLKQLDPLLQQDEIDINQYVPTVIEGIKDQGNGSLYALAPTFVPSALYYNKKIFTDAGVTMPTDGMSWDDVFNLARQLKKGEGKDAIFGFSFNQWGSGANFWDVQNFAAPLQLRMFDDKAETMTVNSQQWKNVWESVYALYKDHIIPLDEDMQYAYENVDGKMSNPYQGRLFLNGRIAMTIGDMYLLGEIEAMNANSEKLQIDKLDWDIVTVPYQAGAEGVGGNIYMNQISAINVNGANQDDAWEFIKFMNGKDWAKFKSRSTSEMTSLKEFIKPREGMSYNIDAFTKMKPAPQADSSFKMQDLYREKPNLRYVQEIGNQQWMKVLSGEQTVEEGLAAWESKGNELLQAIKNNPDGELPEGIIDGGGGGGGIIRPMVEAAAGIG